MNADPSKSHHVAALAWPYILVCHFPVRPLAVGHHLPHHNAVAPHIAGRREFAEGDRFGCCPSDGDLSSLDRKEKEKKNPNQIAEEGREHAKEDKTALLRALRDAIFSLERDIEF